MKHFVKLNIKCDYLIFTLSASFIEFIFICKSKLLLSIIIVLFASFSLTNCSWRYTLMFEQQQIPSALQESFKYSNLSQPSSSLDGLNSSSHLKFTQSFFQNLWHYVPT